MKKILLTISISVLFATPALAHPGGLDQNGGHYCRKNCAKWGMKTGQYHCHKTYCKLKK